MNTRQLLSVGIDIGTTTTQVIFSRLELVNRAAVSQVPRYEFIKREISWQSPVFFTPVDKQGGLKEAELKTLILEQYHAAGIEPESVDSGAIIITGESAKTRNARPAVMALSQSLGDFVVASAGPHLESVIAGHGAGAQTLSEQRLYPAFGCLKRDVRQGSGPHQEKRFAFIGIDKSHQFIKDQIVGIFLLRIFSVAGWIVRIGTFIQRASVRVCHFVGQVDTFFVIIQKRRIVCVRLALAIVSVESVEPLFVGSSFGTRIPQSPLAETSGGISRLLHHSPDSHRVRL